MTADIENRLFDAGCDGATVSQHSGKVWVTFSSEATSFGACSVNDRQLKQAALCLY